MAKITLGARPKTFTRIIKFPMLDGTTGSIEVTYKYRTRSEFGVFVDELVQSAGKAEPEEGQPFSMARLMQETAGANAAYLLKVIEAWNLDEPFNQANLQRLADELPAAAIAIMEAYRAACSEGRLGN